MTGGEGRERSEWPSPPGMPAATSRRALHRGAEGGGEAPFRPVRAVGGRRANRVRYRVG